MPQLFAFVLCFLRQKIINNFATFCDVYVCSFRVSSIDVDTALRQIRVIARWRNGRLRAECGNVEGSEGRCKRPSGVRGGAPEQKYVSKMTHGFFITINSTIQVTHATHVRNRVCPRVELILKIIIIILLLIIFLGFIKSKPC